MGLTFTSNLTNMNKQTFSFLKSVLGQDGAQAMRRAVAKNPDLESYLVPRTLLSWAMTKKEFEGTVPGIENVYVQFRKNEGGYTGSIGKNSNPVAPFSVPTEYHLVAELIQAIGYEVQSFSGTDKSLVTLGKSVDALLRARSLTKSLEKGAIDLPGTTAKPIKPEGAEEAVEPIKQPKMAMKPKLPKLPVLKVEKKDMSKSCKTCSGIMFKSQKFTGCMCWRDLAKHATTTLYSDGAVVEFSKAADKAAVLALYKELK